MAGKWLQGKFSPKNPKKYKGDPTGIIYRSGWELQFMKLMDEHPDILEWSSEEIVIKYRSPKTGKIHRYFPDFFVKKRTKTGEILTEVIEIKPKSQTIPPKKTARKKPQKLIQEQLTYAVNRAKWQAAESFCQKNKYKFTIITEKDLGI